MRKQQQQQQEQEEHSAKPPAPSDIGSVSGDDTSYSNPVDYIQSDDPFIQSEHPQLPERRSNIHPTRHPAIPEPKRRSQHSNQQTEQNNIPASTSTIIDENYSNPVDLISSSSNGFNADARNDMSTHQMRVSVNVNRQTGSYGTDHSGIADTIDDIYHLPVNERSTNLDIRAGRGSRFVIP